MENSDPMKQAFRKCFQDGAYEDWKDYGDGKEARVFFDKNKQVYFRLVPEPGRLYRLEFWVDTYADNRAILQAKLQDVVKGAAREYSQVSYYSGLGCQLRNRMTSEEGPQKDVQAMLKLFKGVIESVGQRVSEETKLEAEPPSSLRLPCNISLADVNNRISNGNFKLPPIQRGKVWNAARCATLWDSIMRGFSIGALSIQPKDDGTYDLLDGQQRSTAICLAYAEFPPKAEEFEETKYDSVLWIDLNPIITDECKYHFYVTTASQPWGYERSTDETRNIKLKASEIKSVLGEDEAWHRQDEKPYPSELWPVKAKAPVPFSLLRKYIQDEGGRATLKGFIDQCKNNAEGPCWNWLRHLNKLGVLDKMPDLTELFATIADAKQFTVQVLDAGNVTESDVALYFTRIGKGGVVPSNEELAYSVLKSKIGGDFREKIEGIVERTGLDRASRVAALAVRYCISTMRGGGGFYAGGVLEKIIESSKLDNAKSEKEGSSLIDVVKEFVSGYFEDLIKTVNDRLLDQGKGFTNWHITRYCQRHSGAVYQFLLMIAASKTGSPLRDAFDRSRLTLGGIAEILSWYAPNPAYVIRKILEKNDFAEAIAEAMRESHYGSARMTMPMTPTKVCNFRDEVFDVLKDRERLDNAWADIENICKRYPDVVGVISAGYGNEAAYSKLIYACNKNRKSEKSLFSFNLNIGVWAEDNCPWDYDHILPHSWVDCLKKSLQQRYAWLVNSIGNLAPIDFSLNRKLSNDARDANYPQVGNSSGPDAVSRAQCDCFVLSKRGADDWCFGKLIGDMAAFCNNAEDKASSYAFIESTLRRFSLIYDCWYTSLGVGGLFKIEGCVEKRKQEIGELSKGGANPVWYYDHNGNRLELDVGNDDGLAWFVWQWIECGDIRISRDNKRYKLKGADPLQDDSWCEDVG